MKSVEYKGFRVTQDELSHHVMVAKDGEMVMHIPCTESKTEAELCEMVDFYGTVVERAYLSEVGGPWDDEAEDEEGETRRGYEL